MSIKRPFIRHEVKNKSPTERATTRPFAQMESSLGDFSNAFWIATAWGQVAPFARTRIRAGGVTTRILPSITAYRSGG